MTNTKDPLVGRAVRVKDDATGPKGKPHAEAGKDGIVLDRTPNGRQYQIRVGERVVNLPMDSFHVLGVPEAAAGGDMLDWSCLVPSRTNRAIIEDEALHEMAATMKLYGVITPLTVRKLPAERLQETFESLGHRHATHEIIAGERRYHAARLAGLRRVPVLQKDVDASTAVIMQLIENLHREDLNALDEAHGLLRLIEIHDYTREQAADALKKSRTHVLDTLRLLNLSPQAQTAIREGTLTRSVALLVAQRPTPALQQEFMQKAMTGGSDGGPMSYRAALKLAKTQYMTDLSRAPFAQDDATLCPKAGACTTCIKRTGAAPELWDKPGTDVCTDTACFGQKKEAYYDRLQAEAKQRGRKVITGTEAREIMPVDGANPAGYILLDKPTQPGAEPMRKLLGEDVPEDKVVLIETPTGAMVEAVPTRAAGAALEARGKKAKPAADDKPHEPTREELQADYQQRWRTEAVRATIEGLRSHTDPELLAVLPPQVAYRVLLELAREADESVVRIVFNHLGHEFSDESLQAAVRTIADSESPALHNMAIMMLVAAWDIAPMFDRPADESLHLDALAPIADVDMRAIKDQAQADMKAEAAARAEASKPKPEPQPDNARPRAKAKAKAADRGEPKTTAAEAQAAIAEAMQAVSDAPAFTAGQAVTIKADVKGPAGGTISTKGCAATVVRASGARRWVVTLPDPWPFPGTEPEAIEVTADYTELEAVDA